ncbi:MAG: 50S ribosomal protein L25 [Pseudomonadota bacterium]|nr:50S ribosomal protein L25 [Pseudomonadota bacterium]
MKHIDLNIDKRGSGKASSRELRIKKLVPGIVYGRSQKATNVVADSKAIVRFNTSKFENAIYKFQSDDKDLNGINALMKEVIVHPVTRYPMHVDFYAVDPSQKVKIFVEVRFIGKPLGTAQGGVFTVVSRTLQVECKVSDIPEFIDADVSHLNVNDSLHLSDLKLPEGIKSVARDDVTLATVSIIAEEVIAVTTVAATAEGAAAPGAAPAAGAAGAPGAAPAAGAAGAGAAPAAGKEGKKEK